MQRIRNLRKNSFSVMLATVVSRILGLVRVQVVSFLLGTTRLADIWGLVFLLPDLFRRLVGEGVITTALIPWLGREPDNQKRVQLAKRLMTWMLVSGIIALLVLYGLIPIVLKLVLKQDIHLHLGVSPARFILPYLLFISFNALCSSLLNIRNKFFWPAFSPVLLSIFMIAGGLSFHALQMDPVWGLSWGVLVGGLAQFGLVWGILFFDGVTLLPSPIGSLQPFIPLWRMLLPALLGVGIFQINLLLSRLMSYRLLEGAIASLDYSMRLIELVMGLFTLSISTALLPELTLNADRQELDFETLNEGILGISFFAFPATFGLVFAGYPVIGILFRHGEFDQWSQLLTYGALFMGAFSLIPLSWYRLMVQMFFVNGKTKPIVWIAILATTCNILLMVWLPNLFPQVISHLGISLALAIQAWVLLVGVFFYSKKAFQYDWTWGMAIEMGKNSVASFGMIPIWWNNWLETQSILMVVTRIIGSVAIYFLMSFLMRSKGLSFFSESIKSHGKGPGK